MQHRSRKRLRSLPRLERLEARQLLAVDSLVISEFMADNDAILADEDGDFSDWIEVHNATDEAVSLAGWSLTDQVDEPARWQFPDVSLSAGEYTVVFASGKDRREVEGELHASFRLSADGEYLALVGPDGAAHEYANSFPRQRSDVSFGLPVDQTLLSPFDATSRIHIPTAADADLDWTSPDFDDSSWTLADGGVGFDEREGLPNVGFEEGDFNFWDARGPASIVDSATAIPTQGVRQAQLVANQTGSQRLTIETLLGVERSSLDEFCGCRATRGAAVSREITVEAGSVVQFDWNLLTDEPSIDASPDFAFASITPNIGLIPLANVDDVDRISTSGFGRETGYSTFEYTFEEGGTYTLGVGVMNAQSRFLDSGVLVDNLLVDGIGSIADTYEGSIDVDVSSELATVESSMWQRYSFDVENPDAFTSLILSAQYDDGIVAHLNGQQVVVRNAPDSAQWNSSSLGARPDALGLSSENIVIPTDRLVAGTNVLALQGLKESTADETFLLRADLIGLGEIDLSAAYMPNPTPGEPNLTGTFSVVDDVQFSAEHGFANEDFELTMTTTTPDAEIRYTTDGSVPTVESAIYELPVVIDASTVVRAAAFRDDLEASRVSTQSYLFVDDVLTQDTGSALDRGFPQTWSSEVADYEMDQRIIGQNGTDRYQGRYAATVRDDLLSIPTLSVVMEMDDLFGPRGIYANATKRGIEWERPTSVELINPNGDEGFQIDAGIRIQGGISRFISSKSSLRLLFKEEYGSAKLNYPLFGDENPSEFDSVSLRSSTGEHLVGIHYIRDEFLRRSQLRSGNVSSRGTYMHLFLNGLYWGMYNPVERIDSQFAENHFGGDKDEYDVLNAGDLGAEGVSAVDGTIDSWNELVRMTRDVQTARTEEDRTAAYLKLKGLNADGSRNEDWEVYLDTDNYIDYLITNVYARNGDWPIRNYYMLRRRGPDSTGFKFFVWDAEFTLDVEVRGRDSIMEITSDGPGVLFPMLLQSEAFRVEFADRAQNHFSPGGVYYVNPNNRRYDPDNPQDNVPAALYAEIANEIRSPLVPESARWGNERGRNGPVFTRDEQWEPLVDFNLDNFFPNRSRDFLNDLIRNEFYREPPVFSLDSGAVDPGQVLELLGTGTIYYTVDGSDPRNVDGTVAESAIEYTDPLTIDSRLQIRTRSLEGTRWTAIDTADYFTDTLPADSTNLRISEVNFNPHDPIAEFGEESVDNDQFEFVEIVNLADRPIELESVEFIQRDGDGIAFSFGNQTLSPNEYLVVPKNRSAFVSRFGSDVPLAIGQGDDPDQWVYDGRLGNGGERITLVGPSGQTIQAFEYDDTSEWPGRSDGNGSALEVIDFVEGDLSDPSNFRSSSEFGGSPGTRGRGPDNRIVINEVLANSNAPDVDTVELLNTALVPIDLSGWYLSDSNDDYLRYQISDGTVLAPGEYLVLDEREFGFGLNSTRGDDVFLIESDQDGRPQRFVDRVEFGASEPGISFGRWPNGEGRLFPMSSTTLGEANGGPLVSSVIISEVHYEPRDPDDEGELTESDVEFVELHNWTDEAVDLSNYQLDGDIQFSFIDETLLPAGESIVVLPIDPLEDPETASLVRLIYRMDLDAVVTGPFAGQLDNQSGLVELRRDLPNAQGDDESPTIVADFVRYENIPPWPDNLNASGQSLTRAAIAAFGGFPTSWKSESRSPGKTDFSAAIPGDVTLDGLVNVDDVDGVCSAVHEGAVDSKFDLNQDGQVTQADLQFLLSEILDTSPGDADLNGVFNSSDLVQVFRTAEYEDSLADNSTWSDGDWNCDGDFDSSDLVVAFRSGAYSLASNPTPSQATKLPAAVDFGQVFSERDESSERIRLAGIARPDVKQPDPSDRRVAPAPLRDVFDMDELRRRKRSMDERAEVDLGAVDRFFEHDAP